MVFFSLSKSYGVLASLVAVWPTIIEVSVVKREAGDSSISDFLHHLYATRGFGKEQTWFSLPLHI